MTNKNSLELKIASQRQKLLKACLRHDESKIIKHQQKLLRLYLQQQLD